MPLFRRSRNQHGSGGSGEVEAFPQQTTFDDSWQERKSLDVRNSGRKRRPRLFTFSNDDRPKTATGATGAQFIATPRKRSWAPPPLPKDDVPSLVASESGSGSVVNNPFISSGPAEIGVALGSPTEMEAPPMPARQPPPLPSSRGRAATLPYKTPSPETGLDHAVGSKDDAPKSEIKRWKTVSSLFGGGKKARSTLTQDENVRPSTSAGHGDISRSRSKSRRWSRKSKLPEAYTNDAQLDPMPGRLPSSRTASGMDSHDPMPKSSTSLDVSIPNAELGRYSSLFSEAMQSTPSHDCDKSYSFQAGEQHPSLLARRQVGIENLTIKSPVSSTFHALTSDSKVDLQSRANRQLSDTMSTIPGIALSKPLPPIALETSAPRHGIRRSKSAGEFLSLGTRVLSSSSKDPLPSSRSFSTRTPQTPPLEALFTQRLPPASTTEASSYVTPRDEWQDPDDSDEDNDDESEKRESKALDESYAYLTKPGGLSHHSDISSALLSYAHGQGQLSLDTTTPTIAQQDEEQSSLAPGPVSNNNLSLSFLGASPAPLTSPLPNSPLSFLSARSSPSKTAGGMTPRLVRHGYDTPITPCVATAEEVCVTSVRKARTFAQSTVGLQKPSPGLHGGDWDVYHSDLDSSNNSPQLSADHGDDSSDSDEHGDDGPDSEEALFDTARIARVITPEDERRSFRASLDEHMQRRSNAVDLFAAQEGLWREVGECWGVRGSRLGLGLEVGS